MHNFQNMHLIKTHFKILLNFFHFNWGTHLHFEFHTIRKQNKIKTVPFENFRSNLNWWHYVSNHKLMNNFLKLLNLIFIKFHAFYSNFLFLVWLITEDISKSSMTNKMVILMTKAFFSWVKNKILFWIRSKLTEKL